MTGKNVFFPQFSNVLKITFFHLLSVSSIRRDFNFFFLLKDVVKLLSGNVGSGSVSVCCGSVKNGRTCSGSARDWRWKDKNWKGSAWRGSGLRGRESVLSRYSGHEHLSTVNASLNSKLFISLMALIPFQTVQEFIVSH